MSKLNYASLSRDDVFEAAIRYEIDELLELIELSIPYLSNHQVQILVNFTKKFHDSIEEQPALPFVIEHELKETAREMLGILNTAEQYYNHEGEIDLTSWLTPQAQPSTPMSSYTKGKSISFHPTQPRISEELYFTANQKRKGTQGLKKLWGQFFRQKP